MKITVENNSTVVDMKGTFTISTGDTPFSIQDDSGSTCLLNFRGSYGNKTIFDKLQVSFYALRFIWIGK